jgi:hypothetical protein
MLISGSGFDSYFSINLAMVGGTPIFALFFGVLGVLSGDVGGSSAGLGVFIEVSFFFGDFDARGFVFESRALPFGSLNLDGLLLMSFPFFCFLGGLETGPFGSLPAGRSGLSCGERASSVSSS